MNVKAFGLICLGFSLGFFVFGLPAVFADANEDAIRDKTKFEVIDKYKNCDVVRYDRTNFATYVYFLHCSTPQ